MGDQTQVYVQVAATSGQTLVWLLLAFACLTKARAAAKPPAWAALGAVGATLLFVPSMTGTTANLQVVFSQSDQIFRNFYDSSFPVFFTLMQVTGTVLLLAALLVGRRPVTVGARPVAA